MKLLVTWLLLVASLFANEKFLDNIEYKCINTHSIQKGVEINVNEKEAQGNPFMFTIKEKKLYTKNNIVFNFMMKNGELSSYSNADFMLLLTKDLGMGLVPKKSRGQLQYYFQCNKRI